MGVLYGPVVQGDCTLEGNEEALDAWGQPVVLNQYRNAVRSTGELSNKRYPFEIVDEFKPALIDWAQNKSEDDCFTAMGSINGVPYVSATEVEKDAWAAANADRILYGSAVSNGSSFDNSASLLNVDSSTDVLNTA